MVDQGIFRAILSSIAPQNCLICGDIFLGFGTCKPCFSLVKPRLPPLCDSCACSLPSSYNGLNCINCQLNPPSFESVYTQFSYEPVAGHIIKGAKRWGLPRLLNPLLKGITVDKIMKTMPQIDRIIPIPDRTDRFRQRGFSATKLIANQLGKAMNGKPVSSRLRWRKATKRQSVLSKKARLMNMRGAFKAHNVEKEHLLLVDDVYTTGSTLRSASRALKLAGAASVHAFALAYRSAEECDLKHAYKDVTRADDRPIHHWDV